MSKDCYNCITLARTRGLGSGKIRAKISTRCNTQTKFIIVGDIRPNNSTYVVVGQKFANTSNFKAKESVVFNPVDFVSQNNGFISGRLSVYGNIKSRLLSRSNFVNVFTNKLSGPLFDYSDFISHEPKEKLYPSKDIIINIDDSYFVNENNETTDLYESLNEGVFDRDYNNSTFIQPSSIYTVGTYRYKFNVNNVFVKPEESYLLIRAAAPTYTNSSNVPPLYKLSNIRFEDPSGNLIIKYKDLDIRGDADYQFPIKNYTTYVTDPEINYGALTTWDNNYPILGSGNHETYINPNASGYTLNLDLDIECLDDPFSPGFNFGYEENSCELKIVKRGTNDYLALDGAPISSQSEWYHLNPKNNTVRISAIEICNNGPSATLTSHFLPVYTDVSVSGLRINRTILPAQVLAHDFDTGIYPDVNSVWKSTNDYEGNIIDNVSGDLTWFVRNQSTGHFITLTDPQASGKLKLKFSHEPPTASNALRGGAFNIGYLDNTPAFDVARLQPVKEVDSFFTIDSVALKVVAKKASGIRDYSLDIVGYSDDKLLNVTSSVGGFLQNIEGSGDVGNIPLSSGLNPINELALSAEAFSEKEQYFETTQTNNAGGDHYKLSTSPLINTTEFAEYTIPLYIYEDNVALGKSKDYSMSSYFESLYMDIYPIPSGASIASIKLIVSYKPSNALMLHALGEGNREFENRDVVLLPSYGIGKDNISSYGVGLFPHPSYIKNIPHAFATASGINGETTLKTNYSRRWRGSSGDKVISSFSDAFDFSVDKDFIAYPFINYYDFNNVTSSSILPFNITNKTVSSELLASGSINVVNSVGSRFISTPLFDSHPYGKSIDWSIINFDQYMFGKIQDAYDNAIRVSGVNSYLYSHDVGVLASGFAAFIRFSPDITVSGVGYNLFNSGVLFGQFESDLSYALAFDNGYLTIYAKDTSDNIVKLQDTITYDNYIYPLCVAITYNEENDNKLRLYTDNEIAENFVSPIIESDSFDIKDVSGPLTVGYSAGSGIGMNMFITDFAVSYFSKDEDKIGKLTRTNIINFFEDLRMPYFSQDSRYKLWQRLDNNTDKWNLGAFKICQFNREFDRFTKRVGSDYVFHYLKSDGLPYETFCDFDLPENIPSGVAYHTQIENDMLRLNLGAASGTFKDALYSPLPRINKNLPRGYNFEKEAFVVETILEHDTYNDIVWPDGKVGPRFIVSLYTESKEPTTYPTTNYGLINRYIHYLEPSGCWRKLSSVFDSNSFFDEDSEPWSNFPTSQRLTEFNHKYFSKDINDMFLQYDIVYPSGSAFESTIKLHAVNVKLKNALIEARDLDNELNLHVSGQKIWRESLNLSMPNVYDVAFSGLDLYTNANISGVSSETVNLHCSGAVLAIDSMLLHSITVGTVDNIGGGFFGSNDPFYGLAMHVSGELFDDEVLPLYLENKIEDQTSSGIIALVTYNKLSRNYLNDSISIYTRGSSQLENFFPDASMNLYLDVDIPPQSSVSSTNLYINAFDPSIENISNSLSLFTINYAPPFGKLPNQSESINWDGDNFGVGIELDDDLAGYPTLSPNDEIRGVNITCFGNCDNGGTCKDLEIITHETSWGDTRCVDGGIFRASNVYTNLEASGFNTDVGYSGHFYGIRKYVGLIPNAPYKITVTGKTANADIINVPREIDTIEYGTNNEVAFSGTKLIADDPYSEFARQEGDMYGKSVSVKGDLMVVGAPHHTIKDVSNNDILDAGAVFVYRRNPAPSGYDWEYDKADWQLETKLRLPFPSGDYLRNEIQVPLLNSNGVKIAEITERVWRVGQEGRQLGHSVDASSTEREIIVAGGPSAKWSRTFEELQPSGVSIGLFIFTDEFTPEFAKPTIPPSSLTYTAILDAIKDKDILFKYFAQPFPIKFNIKVIICDCNADVLGYVSPEFPAPKPDGFVYKKLLHRHIGNEPADQSEKIFNGIKSIFEEAFPYDNTKLNNNIPAILGFFIDDSSSFGTRAIQPELDQFIEHYKDYSFASGLVDFYNQPSEGGTAIFEGSRENWIEESIDVLNFTLDFDRLKRDDQVRFFAESLENFNTELEEFNDPPPSGGAVCIFEKESGVWNLIQIIESPTNSNIIAPDRFGHAVKISENGKVIVVGSPYMGEAFTVYQYDPREKERMYNSFEDWINYHRDTDKTFGYYYSLLDRYTVLKNEYGKDQAARIMYLELTQEAKYDLRSNYKFWLNRSGGVPGIPNYFGGYYQTSKTGPIQEYEKIFSYGYGSIPYVASQFNGFLLEKFAPTSRLGYSVAVNEDGSIVAAGAPTDSFNEYDDQDVYYFQKGDAAGTIDTQGIKNNSTLYSYVNAGAVRLFESREYFPHNLAIEYGKFGNLAYENRGENEEQFFNHMPAIYNEVINYSSGRRIPFIKTPFDEVDIPEEAGLVFIITPAIDALSDEILTNIKDWLALGDRHLVLVGEDPVWEENGLYAESNDLINRILEGLNSRMRIKPARNIQEALVTEDGCPTRPNILPSTRPSVPRRKSNARPNYIFTDKMYAYGVGDIRLHYPGAFTSYECSLSKDYPPEFDISYQALNGKCKIPLTHNGDLRAEWYEYCQDRQGRRTSFAQNWGLFFGTYTPDDYGCYDGDDDPPPVSVTAGYDPFPLLAAAEYPDPVIITYPAVPPQSSYLPVEYEDVPVDTQISAKFGSVLNDDKQFVWSSDDEINNFNSVDLNIGSYKTNPGQFFDPIPYNAKDPILQATGISKVESEEIDVNFYEPCYYATRESIDSSSLFLIAGLSTESAAVLKAGNDTAINFYKNIVEYNSPQNTTLHIAQLGEWTNRQDFTDAFSNSILESVFNNLLHTVDKNISTEQLLNSPTNYEFNVCWIANPQSLPDSDQLERIKTWLAQGNKKIIITYEIQGQTSGYDPNFNPGNISFESINIVNTLCEMLGSTMKPVYLPNKNRYALHIIDGQFQPNLTITPDTFFSNGYPNTDKDNISQLPYNSSNNFVPIDKGDGEGIAYFNFPLKDTAIQTTSIWQMKAGVAEVKFPVIPGSGYKIFVDLAAERFFESQRINMQISDCVTFPTLGNVSNGQSQEIFEYDADDNRVVIKQDNIGLFTSLSSSSFDGTINTTSFTIQTASNTDEISIYLSSNDLRINNNGYVPRTPRLIAISGCLVNIEKETRIIYQRVPTKYDWVITSPGIPERTETYFPPLRQISTDNTKYCPGDSDSECAEALGGQLIEDGPIVVAQELEQVSSFEYGENRSRITVISDSSLIQGRCIADENGVIHSSTVRFLQSLYPPNPSNFVSRGRQFNIQNKIISPERASPHKLVSITNNIGHVLRFNGTGSSSINPDKFVEYIYDPGDTSLDRPKSLEGHLDMAFLQPLNDDQARTPEEEQQIKDEVIQAFENIMSEYGAAPKFSGVIEGKMYADASYNGGIPQIMTDTGYDYLDFERFPSGYPGDLFGYAIDLYKNRLIVGAPFVGLSGENIVPWSGVQVNNTPSGMMLSYNGGAGAVYVFDKTGNGITPQGNKSNWECTRKIRPNTINVGQDLNNQELAESGFYLGDHNYTADDLLNESIITDQFGYSVDMDADVLVIGAPGHDFENYIQESGGAFINKAFGSSLNISTRNVIDVGESGIRDELTLGGSGTLGVLNNGAVFVFENRIYDWINKTQRWEFIEKIVPQGYNSRLQRDYDGFPLVAISGSENDYFGKSVSIDRARRTDGDYTIAIGTPHHKFANSGNHISDQPLLNAGAIYTFDAMLREKEPSKADPNAFIQARIFGDGDEIVRISFSNGEEYNKRYEASGIVYSNNQGEIFLEASGQDPLIKGFISHRPFIESVKGGYLFGTIVENAFRLYASGRAPESSGNVNLFIESEYGNVYNSLGLYEQGVLGLDSGNLVLYTDCPSGIEISESGFCLYASGTGFNTDTLNLRIRGK